MKFTISLIILIFIGTYSLLAVKYPIINYQTADGLPQNQINAIIQGEWGNILVGTQSGMGKFDGNQFEVYTSNDGLVHNFITGFALDDNHHLWIATHGGLSRIDEIKNAVANFPHSEPIAAITWDKTSNLLWVITGKGIYYLKKNEETYRKYDKLLNLDIKDVLISTAGVKYFYSDFVVVVENSNKKTIIKSKEKINVLKTIGKNEKEQILAGTENGLFLLANGAPYRWIKYLDLPPELRNITDIVEDETGNMWLGTTRGLLYYNRKENNTLTITKENGLVNNNITKIFIDKEKNIFIGTRWGLSQLSLDLFKMYDVADGLPHEFIWCFEEDEDNNSILIGCDTGIVELKKKDGKIYDLPINNRLRKTSVRAMVKVSPKDFFIGTRNHGIYRWNCQDKLEQIHPTAQVFSVLKAPSNNGNIVWWGTDNGLLRYDLKSNTFKTFQEGLKDKNIWALALYDEDTLLVGTGKGVQKFHKGKFVPFRLGTIIGNTTINDIKVASKFEILVATELNGLYIYRHDENDIQYTLIHLTTANGLTHNDVWSVINDGSGNIWFNTSVSLDRYSKGFISHFNKKTGLYGNEGAIHAAFKDKSGKLYFGIVPGFVEISPRERSSGITAPILYIRQIICDASANSKINPVVLTGNMTLPYRQNNVEFHYIAVSTRKENPVLYRTRLFPFDKQWSEPTQHTFVTYMNLPPDRYTFQVEANNGGGETPWIESRNTITLTIEKPFWLSVWFILLIILFGFGFILLFIKIRLNALENQKRHLEKLVKQRTEELARLSITDPLTDLKNRRYLEEKIKEDISLIERAIYDHIQFPGRTPKTPFFLLGIFILDIDHFKKVNDLYGHKAGDTVIVEIARLLLEMFRNSDTIVRWGGEEFLVITRQTEMDNSFEMAERIRKRIEEYPFKIDETIIVNKTVSIGFAYFPFIPGNTKTVHWTQVISLADSALYIAKKNGRNLTVGLKAGQRPFDTDAKEIVADITMGIDMNYIELVSSKKNLKTPQPKS